MQLFHFVKDDGTRVAEGIVFTDSTVALKILLEPHPRPVLTYRAVQEAEAALEKVLEANVELVGAQE